MSEHNEQNAPGEQSAGAGDNQEKKFRKRIPIDGGSSNTEGGSATPSGDGTTQPPREGGYSRPAGSSYSRPPREGGYSRPSGGAPREGGGGYNREGGGGGQRTGGGGYNRSGGGGGGYNRGGGGNRPGGPRPGGGNRPFNRNNRNAGPPSEKSMYYIALLCPLEIDEQMDNYKTFMKETYGCEVASKSPAHVTLVNPFFLSDGKHKDLLEKLEAFDSIVTDVSIEIDGFNHFENRVIFADVVSDENLTALQEQIENYLRNSGFPFIKEAKKPYHPHVTIATRDIKVDTFEEAWSNFEGKTFKGSFSTNAIHVMKLVEEKWIHDKQFVLK
jgi:2'-5' RNA ligase